MSCNSNSQYVRTARSRNGARQRVLNDPREREALGKNDRNEPGRVTASSRCYSLRWRPCGDAASNCQSNVALHRNLRSTVFAAFGQDLWLTLAYGQLCKLFAGGHAQDRI